VSDAGSLGAVYRRSSVWQWLLAKKKSLIIEFRWLEAFVIGAADSGVLVDWSLLEDWFRDAEDDDRGADRLRLPISPSRDPENGGFEAEVERAGFDVSAEERYSFDSADADSDFESSSSASSSWEERLDPSSQGSRAVARLAVSVAVENEVLLAVWDCILVRNYHMKCMTNYERWAGRGSGKTAQGVLMKGSQSK